MSSRDGSTKNRVGSKLERITKAYCLKRASRSSPPHEIPVLELEADGELGGYVLCLGSVGGFWCRVNERDSSSWK